MKYLVSLSLLIITTICFVQCKTNTAGLAIDGDIANASNLNVYLDKTDFDNAFERVAQGTANASGSFTLTTEAPVPAGQYRLRIGSKSVDLVLDETNKSISVEGDLNTLQNFDYTVVGSDASEYYRNAMSQLTLRKLNATSAQKVVDEASSGLLAAALAAKMYTFQSAALPVHQKIEKRLKEELPDSDFTKNYSKKLVSLKSQGFKGGGKKYAVEVGDPAIDIAMAGLDGKVQKLSDQKGKIVLLDFWASWCGPCRKANPHVVELYDKYNKQGFTVFSVSLDGLDTKTKQRLGNQEAIDKKMESSKKRWADAIKKDNLKWGTHVSDLAKWENAASTAYGVSSIPTTFLIDKEGKIAALNPRYNLEEEIKKLL